MGLSPTIGRRMEKIEGWLVWAEQLHDEMLSRPSETASLSGWNDKPRVRPCECRSQWKRGKLCLVCNNTSIRACWPGEEGIDPYALDSPSIKGGFTAKSSGDESESQKKASAMSVLNDKLRALIYAQRQRDGDIPEEEDPMISAVSKLARKPYSLKKIEKAVYHLACERPDLYRTLPHGKLALLTLATMVPGKIDSPQ